MTTITHRQAEILRIVYAEIHPNARRIADKRLSPNRLKVDLDELTRKHLLQMQGRPTKGTEHIYTITDRGISYLLKYEADLAEESITRITTLLQEAAKISPQTDHDWRKHVDEILKGKVRLTREEEDKLFAGSAYKWMLESNKLLDIAISTYKKTNDESLRRMNQGYKDPLDVYFRINESALEILPRERVLELEDAERRLELAQVD